MSHMRERLDHFFKDIEDCTTFTDEGKMKKMHRDVTDLIPPELYEDEEAPLKNKIITMDELQR